MKTIFRSPLIWAALAAVLGFAIYRIISPHYGTLDFETFEQIPDTDPRFTPDYVQYINEVLNCPYNLMRMLFPLLGVIVAGVVMMRDWGDGFFEVERAGGVKVRDYYLGRFLAVFTFVTFVAFLTVVFAFHGYFITRGLPEGMTLGEYLKDSNWRFLRVFFICDIPAILRVIAFTFLFAGILKNGVTGTIVGTGYAVLIYVTTVMNNIHHRLPWFYNAYITPVPQYLYHYWGFYGTERFGQRVLNPYTTDMMFLCVESLYLIAAAVAFGAYVCVKKRRI